MARTACIFCGAPADSREHLFPDWIGEEFKRRFGLVDVRDRTGPYGTVIGAPKVNIRVKCVCTKCNTGWMSRLEDAVKPLVLPMLFSDERRTFSPDDQRILATWAMKFSMVLTYHNREPASRKTYLLGEGQDLKARLRPPPATWVWLAHYTGLRAFNADAGQIREKTDAPHRFPLNSNRTTFTIGQMALQLLRVRTLELVEVHTPPPWNLALIQIWPSRGTVDWPPRVDVSDSVFAPFKDRFVGGDSGVRRVRS